MQEVTIIGGIIAGAELLFISLSITNLLLTLAKEKKPVPNK